MTTAAHEYRLKIRLADKSHNLDYRQAFFFGYSLTRKGKFEEATPVFESLARSEGGGPSATIMLAYCRAGLKDFVGSRETLDTVFPDDVKEKADQLHTTFVYLSVGMWEDATKELAVAAKQCPDLAVICLLLGDLMLIQKKRAKALMCWKLAAARDGDKGEVAATAKRLLASQPRQHKRA